MRTTQGTVTLPRSLPQGHLPGTPPRDTSLGHLPGTPPRDITPRHLPGSPPWGTSLGHLPGTPPWASLNESDTGSARSPSQSHHHGPHLPGLGLSPSENLTACVNPKINSKHNVAQLRQLHFGEQHARTRHVMSCDKRPCCASTSCYESTEDLHGIAMHPRGDLPTTPPAHTATQHGHRTDFKVCSGH